MKKSKYYVRPDGLHETIRTINGKRVAFRGKSDREVDRKMLEYTERQSGKIKFSEVAEAWWESIENDLEYNTLHGYKAPYNSAVKKFGTANVSDLVPQDIQNYVESLAAQKYSKKTITNYLQIVRQILAHAVLLNYIKYNPAEACTVRHGEPRKYRQASTKEEAEIIKAHASDPDVLPLMIVYSTGIRHAELMSLRYEDIDRKNKMIYIKRSMYYQSNKPMVKLPKTEKGIRAIPLLKILEDVLPNKKTGYIVSPDGGESMYSKSLGDDVLDNARKRIGIQSTLHQIRHGYATVLEEAGISDKSAQEYLGHAQISTTKDIYTHIRKDKITSDAEMLSSAF